LLRDFIGRLAAEDSDHPVFHALYRLVRVCQYFTPGRHYFAHQHAAMIGIRMAS
jgi:hypothetical protein